MRIEGKWERGMRKGGDGERGSEVREEMREGVVMRYVSLVLQTSFSLCVRRCTHLVMAVVLVRGPQSLDSTRPGWWRHWREK